MADSFVWGGITWGFGDLAAFKSYLSAHGTSYSTWAANHPDAAAILEPPASPNASQDFSDTSSSAQGAAKPPAASTPDAGASPNAGDDVSDVSSSAAGGSPGAPAAGSAPFTTPIVQAPTESAPPPPPPPAPTAPPVVQVTFTHDDLVNLWLFAGGPSASADIAAAIALAESHGCKYAKAGPTDDRPAPQCVYRQTDGENSYGLWQVNRVSHPGYSADDLYDAVGNAKAAVEISNGGTDFGPWTTYTSGAFTAYLTGSPSTSSIFTTLPAVTAITATKPAGAAAAYANVIGQYASNVPATNTKVGNLADGLINIFKG